MLTLNRSQAARVLLFARIGAGVGATLTAVAFLAPVSAGTPELPPPPQNPIEVSPPIVQSVPAFQPEQLAYTLNDLGPQPERVPAVTGTDPGSADGSKPVTKQPAIISPSFKWRYLGRIQTGDTAYALIDTGDGQKLLRQGSTLDHAQLGPFTLSEIERDRVVFAGVSEERELERSPRQETVVGSFTAAPAQTRPNVVRDFSTPARTAQRDQQRVDERMAERRRRLQQLREERLQNRIDPAERDGYQDRDDEEKIR